jgi:AraC-like DNA-binding protein
MSSSRISRFTDTYAYQAVHAEAEILVTAQGEFCAELAEVNLPRLRIRSGCENLPRISHIRVPAERALLYFPSGARQPPIHVGGKDLSAGEILVCAASTTHHDWTAGPCRWGSISLTTNDLAAAGSALLGRDLDLASVTRVVRPDSVLASRLMNLHESAERLARLMPDIFACPELARGLEQALVYAMIKCLTGGTSVEMGRSIQHHSRVIARFEAVLAANRGQPLYLAEICAATGVSERTLRVCCNDYLGMGPIQYLHLRRMHLAHRAFMLADARSTTVTEIATSFGFWELGRFSVEYRALFGESPSVALHRRSDRPKGGNGARLPLPPRNQARHVGA